MSIIIHTILCTSLHPPKTVRPTPNRMCSPANTGKCITMPQAYRIPKPTSTCMVATALDHNLDVPRPSAPRPGERASASVTRLAPEPPALPASALCAWPFPHSIFFPSCEKLLASCEVSLSLLCTKINQRMTCIRPPRIPLLSSVARGRFARAVPSVDPDPDISCVYPRNISHFLFSPCAPGHEPQFRLRSTQH